MPVRNPNTGPYIVTSTTADRNETILRKAIFMRMGAYSMDLKAIQEYLKDNPDMPIAAYACLGEKTSDLQRKILILEKKMIG
jgi:hypothetical protein